MSLKASDAGESADNLSISRRTVLKGGALGLGIAASAISGLAFDDAALAESASIQLAEGGNTTYRVFVGVDEDSVVRHAANELAYYLGEITTATFQVVVGSVPPSSDRLLIVGRNNAVTARLRRHTRGDSFRVDELGDDGFSLRTNGNVVFLAGDSSRGTLYSVYWFIDRLCGVRWWAADSTYIPRDIDLGIPVEQLNTDIVPRFRYRQVYSGDGRDPVFRQRNLLNGNRGWDGVGGSLVPVPDTINTWSTYWPADPFGGNFHQMVKDQTLWSGGQLLCMDTRTRQVAADSLVDVLQARIAAGKDASYGFEQQDTAWVPDAASLAFAEAHGNALSAPILDMVNDVVSRVRSEVPDARLSTQAYQFSLAPPVGMRADAGVVMTVAPYNANYGQSLFEGDNEEIGNHIENWCGVADNVVLWDYVANFSSYIQPFPNWWAMGQGLRTLAQLPAAQGYFAQSSWNSVGTEFADLRVWMIGRLAWDPLLEPDALIREFLDGYYGPASSSMYEYMQLMRSSVADTSTRLTQSAGIYSAYLNFDTMRQADAILQAAESAAHIDATLLNRVKTVRLGVDYVILMRCNEFVRVANESGIIWDPNIASRLLRFSDELAASGLTLTTGAGGTPEQLKEQVRVATLPATVPATVAGLPASNWFDYQDVLLRLHRPVTTLVQDENASNGFAVQMPGASPAWGVQLPLSALPPGDDSWKIYASVRVDTGTASPTSTAIIAGVWPPIGNAVNVPVSELSDGEYHEIPLPGTYSYDTTGRYAYIAPPNSASIPYVYVDRVFIVKI